MPTEEAILTGRIRLNAGTEQRLEGRAFVLAAQPDLLVDGNGEYIRDGNGDYQPLGTWDSAQLQGFVEIDLSVVLAALPRLGARQQIADLEVWLSPYVGPGWLAAEQLNVVGISLDLALGQPARWSFSLPYKKQNPLRLTRSTRSIPELTGSLGSPYGHGFISLIGAYLTDTGQQRVGLVHIGVASEATVSLQSDQSIVTISGGDQLSELVGGLTASFTLPPGSAIPRGTVATMLAQSAAMVTSFWSGTPMHRPFQVVNEPTLPRLYELADADNMVIQQDADGIFVALPEVDTTSPIAMVLGPRDLVSSEGIEITSPGANPPTRVSVSGTQQVLKEEVGVRTLPPRIAKAWSRYRVRKALATQDSAGDVNVIPGAVPEAEALQLVNRTTTRLTMDGDTLIAEETEFEGWYNPEVWRYKLLNDPDGVDGGGDYDAYHDNAYFYDAGATKNDSTPVYKWNRERFGTIGRQRTTHTYDSRNFLTLTETVREGWLTLQRAIKTRANKSIAFEVTNHSAVNILANGISAKGQLSTLDGERFVGNYGGFTAGGPDKKERIRIENSVTDLGYITSTTTTRESWDARPGSGSRYLYGDGTQRDTAEYEFVEVEQEIELWYAEGDSTRHTSISIKFGKVLDVLDEPVDGYFPIATQRVDLTPDPALYVGREDLLEQARAASYGEAKAIRYDLASAALETRYPRSDLQEDFALAENTADLERRANILLALHSAITVSCSVPANWLLRPGMRVHLREPRVDLDHDVHLIAVSHARQGRNAPLLTRLTGRIYVA